MKTIRFSLIVFSLLSGPAWAQDSDGWDWKIAPYLWTVGLDGLVTVGNINQDLDVSFKDILSDLDIGGSVYGEVGKGHHALHFDYTYLRLKPDPTELTTPPFPPDSTLSTKFTSKIFEPAYNFRLDGLNSTTLVLGARYMDIEIRMTPDFGEPSLPVEPPDGPPFPGNPVEVGPSWWDYFVGIKTYSQISTNWDFDFYGTIGGGESDLPWTLQAMFGRRFSNNNRLGLGFRVWNIDYSNAEGLRDRFTRIDTRFYGFMIGYEFN